MKPKGGNVLVLKCDTSQQLKKSPPTTTTATATSCSVTTSTSTTSTAPLSDIDSVLFQLLMLINEGRTPDKSSSRGYCEGVHVSTHTNTHICLKNNYQCHIAYKVKNKIRKCFDVNLNEQDLQSHNFEPNNNSNTTANVDLTCSGSGSSSSSSSSCGYNTDSNSNSIGSLIKKSQSATTTIHFVIDVLLIANCCYDTVKGDLVDTKSNVSYELLERWNFSIMQNKSDNTKHTFNELYQAIRSYLHFSQISSWLNQTNGDLPKTLAYSVFYYNEANLINKLLSTDQNNNNSENTDNDDLNTYLNDYLINDKQIILKKYQNLRQHQTGTQSQDAKAEQPSDLLKQFYSQLRQDDSYLFNYDSQLFPSVNLLCSNQKFYNLTINLKSKKRIIPESTLASASASTLHFNIPHILCTNNIDKSCKYKTNARATNEDEDDDGNDNGRLIGLFDENKRRAAAVSCYRLSQPHLSMDENDKNLFKLHKTITKRRSTFDASSSAASSFSSLNSQFRFNTAYFERSIKELKSLKTTFPVNGLKLDSRSNHTNKPDDLEAIDESLTTSRPVTPSPATATATNDNDELSPVPGERRRLSFDCELNKRQTKQFKAIDSVENETSIDTDFDEVMDKFRHFETTPNINIKRSLHLKLDHGPQTPPDQYLNGHNQSYSPSSPIIVLSNLTSQLTDLCTYTQTQLQLNDATNSTANDSDCEKRPQFYIDSSPEPQDSQQQQQQPHKDIVHYIRSPTDGVCVPIYKNSTDSLYFDAVNGTNTEPTQTNEFSKRNKRCSTKFHTRSGLPLSSSPAPMRKSGSAFGFDQSIRNPKSIKNALSLSLLKQQQDVEDDDDDQQNKPYIFNSQNFNLNLSNRLLGNFEESLLNGRMHPVGIVDGFYTEIGASGSFFPEHVTLPVHAAFYHVCDDVAASPYLGIINLSSVGRRGYKVPNKGTIQVTLFNPNNTVVKMFVVMYDMSDMPANHRTFLRQRTMYVPLASSNSFDDDEDTTDGCKEASHLKSYLRYSIHLRFASSKSGKLYLHTNIKLIFARNKCEIDPRLAKYEYKTFTEAPKNPRYSSKK